MQIDIGFKCQFTLFWSSRIGTTADGVGVAASFGDSDNLLLEELNTIDKASIPQVQSPQPTTVKDYLCSLFQ